MAAILLDQKKVISATIKKDTSILIIGYLISENSSFAKYG